MDLAVNSRALYQLSYRGMEPSILGHDSHLSKAAQIVLAQAQQPASEYLLAPRHPVRREHDVGTAKGVGAAFDDAGTRQVLKSVSA